MKTITFLGHIQKKELHVLNVKIQAMWHAHVAVAKAGLDPLIETHMDIHSIESEIFVYGIVLRESDVNDVRVQV